MTATWEQEEIPDADTLYMRAHRTAFSGAGELEVTAFRDRDGAGMSTDWGKYATPQETRGRARIPADNAVIAMNAGAVWRVRGLSVQHSPLPENRAHTDVLGVYGANKVEARVRLQRIAVVVLPLAAP